MRCGFQQVGIFGKLETQQTADCRTRKAMNLTQEILLKEGKMLPVMEHFYTLQGEGQLTQEKPHISSDWAVATLVVIGVM